MASEEISFENVDGRRRRTTDARLYYSLTGLLVGEMALFFKLGYMECFLFLIGEMEMVKQAKSWESPLLDRPSGLHYHEQRKPINPFRFFFFLFLFLFGSIHFF